MPVPELKLKQEGGGGDGAAVAVVGSRIGNSEVRLKVKDRLKYDSFLKKLVILLVKVFAFI